MDRVGSSMKSLSKVAPPFIHIPISKPAFVNFIQKYLTVSFVAYLVLASAGSSAGFLTSGAMLATRDLLLSTFAFAIIAWAFVSKRVSPAYPAGLTVVAGALYLILARLPNNSGWPNWVKEGKSGVVNLSEEAVKGLLVATALFIA